MRRTPAIVMTTLLALAPFAALAADPDAVARYRGMSVAFGLFGVGILMLFMLTMVGLVLGLLVLWVLMLVDAFKRDWPERSSWIAILILSFFVGLHWLSAILYYLLVKQKNVGKMPKNRS